MTVKAPTPTILMALCANPDRFPPTVNAANLLAESGFDVVIASRDARPDDPPTAVYHSRVTVTKVCRPHASVAGNTAAFVAFVAGVVRLARRMKPAAIIGYDMHGLLAARIARWAAHQSLLVYHCHDVWEVGRVLSLRRLVKALEPSGARAADWVVLPDRQRAARFRAAVELGRDPLVVANAPRLAVSVSGGALRRRLGALATGRRIVLRHGVIARGHALEKTVASMSAWGEDAVLVLMGRGPMDFHERLRTVADSIGCAKRLVVLEAVGYPAVLEYLPDADVGLALYDGESPGGPWAFSGSASNKALEFMAAGVPFVVDLHPAAQFYVNEGVAIPADPTEVAGIGRAISCLLGDEGRRRAMAQRARRLHAQSMNFEAQFMPLLDRLRARSHPFREVEPD